MSTLRTMIKTTAMMVVASGISNAAVITFSASQGPQLTDFTFNLVLPKFDSSIGTLTGATIRFTAGNTVASLNLTNTSPANQTFKYVSDADFLVTGNTADSTLTTTDLLMHNFTTGGFITLGPTGSGACPVATPSAACNSVNYAPAPVTANTGDVVVITLGNYVGIAGSTFTLSGFTSTGTTFTGGGGNVSSAQVTNGTASAIVTYTYSVPTGTPEPATMALMGTSLLGLALIGRRKK